MSKRRPFVLLVAGVVLTEFFASIPLYAQWTNQPFSPQRGDMGVAKVGTKIFFGGGKQFTGSDQENTRDEVSIYDNATGLWDNSERLSFPRNTLAGASAGNKVFFAGGTGAGGVEDIVEIYDVSTGTWDSDDQLPSGKRVSLRSASLGNKVYFGGGFDGSGPVDEIDVYEVGVGWEVTPLLLSVARTDMAAIAGGGKVYFAGGTTASSAKSNIVDVYENGVRTSLTLSQARSHLAAATVGNKVIFAGGRTGTGNSDVVDIFDITTGARTTLQLSEARWYLTAATAGTKVLFVGGLKSGFICDVTGNNVSNVVDIYNDDNGTILAGTPLPGKRFLQSAESIGTKAFFAGGSNNSGNCNFSQTDVYIYQDETIAPTVSSINYLTPATSPTNVTSLVFQVVFSEPVFNLDAADFTKTLTGGLTAGAVSVATVNSTTYNVTVPTVSGSGTIRLDVLNTATIHDGCANLYTSNFTTGQVYTIDQTPPVFSATAPITNATVSDARVSYTLSEALASGTITWTRTGGTADGTIHTQALTGAELAIGPHTNITLTNNPTLVNGTIYSVAFAGTDAAGNAATVVTNTNITFTSDSQPPIATFNPLNSAINVAIATNITITFDEAVRKIDDSPITTGDLATLVELKLTDNAGAPVPFSATIDGTNRIITINPTADLSFSTVYYVEINPVEDASNNATVATNITFTTVAASVPVITAVTIPNVSMKIGDVVTATISVNSDPAVLTLPGGSTIAGFALSNLIKTNNTTYTAQFTVAAGGADIAAASTIPVSVMLNGPGGNSAVYTTAIAQASDPIDVTIPTITSINYLTPATSPTNATSLTFRVIFSEGVLNVAAADFTKTFTGLTSGAISVSAVNATTYNITVPTVSGSGTARLDVLNTATISDVAGNAYASNFTTGQVYTVDQAPPVFSATAPITNATVSDARVSYTLSEALASGTITWTRTGGTADGTIHTQALTGAELAIGPHTSITLTNNPTLVSGAIYSVAFAGTDAAGNAATVVTNTNITFAPAASNRSDIVANNSFNYPQNINYISFQETNNIQNSSSSLNVAKFDIRDGGASGSDADAFPTIITGITLDLGSNFALIRRIALYNESGTTELGGTETTVSSRQISFSSLSIPCADNSSASFTIRVSFAEQVTDNLQFSFTIAAATAQAANSGLASANAGGAVSSTANNNNRIEVIASELSFIQQPSTTLVNVEMTPPVTLEALDANGNRDLDFSGQATLTSQGTFVSNPTIVFASGVGTSSAITFATAGIGLTLNTMNSSGLADATSSTFDINDDSEDIKPTIHSFITPNTADDQNNVLYIENIELYPENKVQLINRWGVTVKSWVNFSNYDTSDPGQADFDFASLSVGNYICIVEYTNSTGGSKKSQSQMINVLK